jgi:hypothetical protein
LSALFFKETVHAFFKISFFIIQRDAEADGDVPIGARSCIGGLDRAFEVPCREGPIRAGLRAGSVGLRASRRAIRPRPVQMCEAGQLGASGPMRPAAVLLRASRRNLQGEKVQVCAAAWVRPIARHARPRRSCVKVARACPSRQTQRVWAEPCSICAARGRLRQRRSQVLPSVRRDCAGTSAGNLVTSVIQDGPCSSRIILSTPRPA